MVNLLKPTVGGIIYRAVNNKTEVLLTKRNVEPFKNYWCIPGGHIEPYEEAETAVIREVREETNLDFTPEFLCYLDEIFSEMEIHNVVLVFYGISSGNIIKSEDEVTEIEWVEINEAIKMELAFCHREALVIFLNRIIHPVLNK